MFTDFHILERTDSCDTRKDYFFHFTPYNTKYRRSYYQNAVLNAEYIAV